MMYKPINLKQDVGRIQHLLSAHTLEVFGPEANLDLCYMFKLIDLNLVRAFGVYDTAENLIGYTMFVLTRDMFQAGLTLAECTAIYIKPEFRGDLHMCTSLLSFSETLLKSQDGIRQCSIATNRRNNLAKFYKRAGYSEYNTFLRKEI